MSVITIACDRCGARGGTESRSLLHVPTSPVPGLRPGYDLCRVCASALALWLGTSPEEAEAARLRKAREHRERIDQARAEGRPAAMIDHAEEALTEMLAGLGPMVVVQETGCDG